MQVYAVKALISGTRWSGKLF